MGWQLLYGGEFVLKEVTNLPLTFSSPCLIIEGSSNQNLSRIASLQNREFVAGIGFIEIDQYPLLVGKKLYWFDAQFAESYRLSIAPSVRSSSPLLLSLKIWSPTMPLSRSGGAGGMGIPISTTATPSTVAAETTSKIVLAANPARKGATIWNNSTATLFLDLDTAQNATASSTSYTVQLGAGDYYELPYGYTGVVLGIWAAANGNALVTELS